MVNYQDGKIYKLIGGGLTYYGSTCADLRYRLCKHKDDFNRNKSTSSKLLFETGDEVKIYLVEKYPCADRMELNARERWYIEQNDCVNKRIPTRTKKEYYIANKEQIKEKTKEYYIANKEQLKEKNKEYYEGNKDYMKEKMKQYREANKEQLKEKKKEWYEANKHKISKRLGEQITCECGALVSKGNILRHRTSKHHILSTTE